MFVCATSFFIFGPAHLQQPLTNGAEPLPNGYVLTATFDRGNGLLSVPTRAVGFGRIERVESPGRPTINGYVRSLEVAGPLVFGAYNWRYDSLPTQDQANQGYFKLDTRNGTVDGFSTNAELTHAVGHVLHLTEAESFHSSDASHKRLLMIERAFVFGLPAASLAPSSFLYLS
jgi:hypothetical protein